MKIEPFFNGIAVYKGTTRVRVTEGSTRTTAAFIAEQGCVAFLNRRDGVPMMLVGETSDDIDQKLHELGDRVELIWRADG